MSTDAPTTYRPDILDEPTHPISAVVAFEHCGRMTLMGVGAVDLMYDDRYVQFDMTMGRAKRRVYVTLSPTTGLYNLAVGKVGRAVDGRPWTPLRTVRDISWRDLSGEIENVYGQAGVWGVWE